jgi:hypothetical protein
MGQSPLPLNLVLYYETVQAATLQQLIYGCWSPTAIHHQKEFHDLGKGVAEQQA